MPLATPADAEPLPRPRLRRGRWLREIIETILIFAVIYVLVNLLSARFIVDGSSMTPTLGTGQYVLVNRVAYLLGQPERGDVIVLHSPEEAGTDLIKRLIGLPGETISITGGVVSVDGVPLDEPYLNAQPRYEGEWALQADEYFVLGDNRNNSRDSHNFGPVKRSALIGRADLIYWPVQDWQIITHSDYTNSPPELPPAE
ncbi:MAG: signal peptidase I [Anaerolineae bacterium]|nr:signal peptidase I [Anaerolineae bacterium]